MTTLLGKLGLSADRFTRLLREMAWILAGQAICFVGGFAGIKILTNIMGPHGYGQLALGLTIAGLLNMYVYGPLANVVARFYSVYREQGQLGVYFAVIRKTHRFLALGLACFAAGAGGVTALLAGREWGCIVTLSLLYGVAGGVNASYQSLQSAVRQRKVVALHQGVDVWLRVVLAVVAFLAFGSGGGGALAGYLLGTLAVTVSQGIFALRNSEIREGWHAALPSRNEEQHCFREFFRYASPFVAFAGFAAVGMYADRWVIQGVSGESAVGIYSAIYQIAAAPVNLLFAMVNQLMVPIIFERAGAMTSASQAENSAGLVRVTVLASGGIALAITAVAYFLGEPLIRLLTSADFAGHHPLLWLTVLGLSAFNIGQLFALKGLYCNRPGIYLWPKAVQAVSFLVLAYLGVRIFGLMGVASALVGSSLLYGVSVVVVNRSLNSETQR